MAVICVNSGFGSDIQGPLGSDRCCRGCSENRRSSTGRSLSNNQHDAKEILTRNSSATGDHVNPA